MQRSKNQDTAMNKKISSFLESLGTGNYDRSLVTEGFIQRINPITKIIFASSVKPGLDFIASDIIRTKYERNGVQVKKINYYKISLRNETHYLAIYFSDDNKIADLRGY